MNDQNSSSEPSALLSATPPVARRDADNNPDQGSAKPESEGAAPPGRKPLRRPALMHPAVFIATLALVLLSWQWLETRGRLEQLQHELAQRLKEGDATSQEARALAKQSQETLQGLQAKMGVVDARLADSQNQQVALEAMYQELARNREDRLILEVEQALNIAAQQLQLAGNVEAALAALQAIDTRLASLNRPQFLALRKALNEDMQRLKATPMADLPGMALKLESVALAVDSLPLAYAAEPKQAQNGKETKDGFWSSLLGDIWGEMKQLIRIERMDRPDPGLLSPNSAFFLRENLKLRLVNARLSLLQRDNISFHEDVSQARKWLDRYFDSAVEPVQAAVATLQSLDDAKLNVEVPSLADSLAALRNLKVGALAAADKAAADQATAKAGDKSGKPDTKSPTEAPAQAGAKRR